MEPAGSLLMTDEWKGYGGVKNFMQHAVINHSTAYAEGSVHTNTIEGFWSLLKRAWYGLASPLRRTVYPAVRHCLTIMRDHVNLGSVDLIYLDPPFNSNQEYNATHKFS